MQSTFHAPSTLLFGAGCRHQLAGQLRILDASRVLIVSDAYLCGCGVVDEFVRELDEAGIQSRVFSGVQPDPTAQNVLDGIEHLLAADAHAIVAIGGGSAMDAAKIIGVAARNPGPLHNLQGYHKVGLPGLPLVVLPTTSGTGSEATKVAVITDPERQVKMMILDPKIMPRTAIVDFELTLTMPPALTAHVGVDTLTHGLEAYVSRKASAMTDPIALSCIELTARHLLDAWREPQNRSAREAMSLAACQGGMAFTNSSVCLVHGMSRPIGALYHVPHGLSNAVLLPAVTRFSISGAPKRYAHVARVMGLADQATADDAAGGALLRGLQLLNQQLQVPRLRDCVPVGQAAFEAVLEKMAGDALQSGSPQNNPVVPTVNQIVELYREAW